MITADGKCTDCEPTIDWLKSRIAELEAENTRLRELLMLAKIHIGCSCMDCERAANACREEMKRWEK